MTLAEQARAPLVGGNLTRSPGPLVVDVTAMGAVRPRRVLTRAGGRPGDELYVTGWIGAAAVGLAMLEAGIDRTTVDGDAAECLLRYEMPDARVRFGGIIARSGTVSACMDFSDGFGGCGAATRRREPHRVVVEAEALPVHPGVRSGPNACSGIR